MTAGAATWTTRSGEAVAAAAIRQEAASKAAGSERRERARAHGSKPPRVGPGLGRDGDRPAFVPGNRRRAPQEDKAPGRGPPPQAASRADPDACDGGSGRESGRAAAGAGPPERTVRGGGRVSSLFDGEIRSSRPELSGGGHDGTRTARSGSQSAAARRAGGRRRDPGHPVRRHRARGRRAELLRVQRQADLQDAVHELPRSRRQGGRLPGQGAAHPADRSDHPGEGQRRRVPGRARRPQHRRPRGGQDPRQARDAGLGRRAGVDREGRRGPPGGGPSARSASWSSICARSRSLRTRSRDRKRAGRDTAGRGPAWPPRSAEGFEAEKVSGRPTSGRARRICR